MRIALHCSKKVHVQTIYPLLMTMILSYEQWLADADCPELIDAFNGGIADEVVIEDDNDGE